MRAGIVLAGGRGRRIGGNKAAIRLDGVTLVDRAVAILQSVGSQPVVVADHGDDGPLAAMLHPLRKLTSAFEVFVLACDLPLAGPAVARLAELPAGAAIAVDSYGREQPLCARWPRAVVLEEVEALVAAGERRMSALVDAIDPEFVMATAVELLNVNTPADLADAERRTLHG
ncbi:MAG: NTP transferase domain-containing protein [Actinobacteria bacterium]|nr:NTP transferase domain-containing protein [Actinomycetota bacterium]